MKLSNYSKIFKALSNEQRLEIFMMIRKECSSPGSGGGLGVALEDKGLCPVAGAIDRAFSKVCGCMKLSRSTISHHFKELQNAGLITCEREGQMYRCTVNTDVVDSLRDFLK
jgi:ArsR family transcriptional regulator